MSKARDAGDGVTALPSAKPAAGGTKLAEAAAGAAASPMRPAAAPAASAPSPAGKGWLGKAAASVPTRFVTGAVVAVFLVATAAFGGLETVEPTPPTALLAGEQHASEPVALTLQRAVLIDSFPEAGASADEGERVLAIVVDAENTWREPLPTLSTPFTSILRLEALPELQATSVARFDDGTIGPRLQPGIPVQLVVTWVVPADLLADGDEIRVLLSDHTLTVGQHVTYGESWGDPVAAAVVTMPVDDVGAGAGADADAAEETP
ncbi:hypothetical protein [Agrococcus sp. ARC_14]|uniref:hypothetical protein n=1 Tax=Agrococcus sp. ARC_14 TaxID=2919927 RepID=UPI001F053FAA|nr:hypothetical protein [Agrococcus sp. ARC_14]MCH1881670.1 hypothetical protein [Agrococcus sp. ARC_14]